MNGRRVLVSMVAAWVVLVGVSLPSTATPVTSTEGLVQQTSPPVTATSGLVQRKIGGDTKTTASEGDSTISWGPGRWTGCVAAPQANVVWVLLGARVSDYKYQELLWQSDGNLVLYSKTYYGYGVETTPRFVTNTGGYRGKWLCLREDGAMDIRDSRRYVIWETPPNLHLYGTSSLSIWDENYGSIRAGCIRFATRAGQWKRCDWYSVGGWWPLP